jgi:arylsulfatase A-like enzyme
MISSGFRPVSGSRRSISSVVLGILISALLYTSSAATSNIVLVTIDSTRADRMGFLGAKATTPSLDALARQSIVFERAYAQAPLTVVSHATLLSGTYPQTDGANELSAPLAASLPYVPDLLHARGYRTAAFVGSIQLDPRNGFAPGFDRGFDVYDAGFRQVQPGETGSLDRSGAQVVARATAWFTRNAETPFFLWVHLTDPGAAHGISYDRAVAAADAAVGKLVSALRAQKLYDDSVIVVAADHGESLGAHGETTHGIFLYDDTIRVPLLLKLPQNQLAGKRVRGLVRLLDIAPTMLEIARVPVPSQMQGQSLLRMAKGNPDSDQPVYSRSDFPQQAFGWSLLESWRAGKYLYIRAPQPELYDLFADPGASRNLAQSSKATLDTMASQLSAFTGRLGKSGVSAGSAGSGLTSSEMQKLASLGYVGLQKSASGANTAVAGTDPKDAIAIANRTIDALLALQERKPEKAIPILRQVLNSQPGAYLAHYELGVALALQQKDAEAIQQLHKAIELRPESAWAQYQMGLSLMKTGDFKASALHLEIVASRLPHFAAAHSALADAYEHLGRKEDAAHERAEASKAGRC